MAGRRGLVSARRFAVVAALAVSVALSTDVAAVAAPDTTPPVLNVPASPAFVVPQQVNIDEYWEFAGVKATIRWDAHDPSGICGYERGRVNELGWDEGTYYASTATHQSWNVTLDNLEGSNTTAWYYVRAHDCAGNVAEATFSSEPSFLDVGDTPVKGWRRVSCGCAAGGSMLRTSTRGASLSQTMTVGSHGGHVALIMAKGPRRGIADIRLDGRLVKSVDTRAKTNTNQWLVWQSWLSKGQHTVTVVNRATSHRPRIDVDGFLVH
jgi:hypothetical protein